MRTSNCCMLGTIIVIFSITGMNERPILAELLKFPVGDKTVNIIEKIGKKFGIYLLEDDDGSKMEAIVENCREDPSKINCQVLSKWIRGGGKQPVTWATLATEIHRCRLTELAKKSSDLVSYIYI